MDDIDRKIIFALSLDSSKNIDKLSKYLNIPKSTVHNRIKKLEKMKVIKGYQAIIDFDQLDMGLTCFIHIILTEKAHVDEVIAKLASNPKVEAIYAVTGSTDIIVKARFKNAKEIGGFNYDSHGNNLRSTLGISRTETSIVLHTAKEHWHVESLELYGIKKLPGKQYRDLEHQE